jgi:hypothetical protein
MPSPNVPRSYSSGEQVPQSGLYLAMHPSGSVSYGRLAFDKGEAFPLCSRCDEVRYTLLRRLAAKSASQYSEAH